MIPRLAERLTLPELCEGIYQVAVGARMPISFQCPECGKKLKAPESAVGKTLACPGCETQVTCPEPIFDAEVVEVGGDGTPHAMAGRPPGDDIPSHESRRPCPMCGEMILATAAKCRFCHELLDPAFKMPRRYGPGDEELSGIEITVAILCAGIGCVTGLVYMIQGKPKGMKMLGLSFLMVVIWNFVILLVQGVVRR
jgi:predicted RNA-binding Zn-ribbon protein involved in translation (DUF1610 family)